MLDEPTAKAVWLRAAQLQADASRRVQERTAQAEEFATGLHSAVPTSGYRIGDVESAAVEAGIGEQFVQLALAELPDDATGKPKGLDAGGTLVERLVLGNAEQSIRVSRIISASPRFVLDAIGKVLPAHPYELLFRDVVGGHPLDGGVLTFTSKKMSMGEHMTGRTNMLRYHLSSLGASLLRVTLRPVAGDANRCDMVITTDLRSGISKNAKIGFGIGAGTGGVGATIGVGLALAAGTPLVIIPGVVGVLAVLGYGTMRLVRVGFHYSLNQARAELEHLLDAVQGSARSQNVFGTPWGTLPPSNGG